MITRIRLNKQIQSAFEIFTSAALMCKRFARDGRREAPLLEFDGQFFDADLSVDGVEEDPGGGAGPGYGQRRLVGRRIWITVKARASFT
ncbi:MAG: hypothetical protein IJU69_06140 [Bacteroidales bacterium]|nr:hypothetical protein [Bacteroidales bacterium]